MSYAVLLYFFEATNLRNYHKFIKPLHDGNSVVQGLFHSFGLWTIYTHQKKRSNYSERFAYPGNDLSFQQKNSKYFRRWRT